VSAGTLDENLRNIQAHPVLGIHYMIDRDGTTRSSVPEGQVAHHVYRFSGRSIAVELINDGDGVDPFPEAQLNALVALLLDIKARRGVKRSGVVRHSDIDQGRLPCDRSKRRKVDPGSAFPFQAVLDRVFPS
jgi:N-acetylmuramoyl-L-alanine amidase